MTTTPPVVGGATVVPSAQPDITSPKRAVAPNHPEQVLAHPESLAEEAIRAGQVSRPSTGATTTPTGAGLAHAHLHALTTGRTEVVASSVAPVDYATWASTLKPVAAYATEDKSLVLLSMSAKGRGVRFLVGAGQAIPLVSVSGGDSRETIGRNAAGIKAMTTVGPNKALLLDDGSTMRLRRLGKEQTEELAANTTFAPPPAVLRPEYVVSLHDGREIVIAEDAALPHAVGNRYTAYIGKPGAMERVPATVEGVGHDLTIKVADITITMRTRPQGGPLAFVDGKPVQTAMSILDSTERAFSLGITDLADSRTPRPKPSESAEDTARAAEHWAAIIRESTVSRAYRDASGDLVIAELERKDPEGIHLPGSGERVAIDTRSNEARLLENHSGSYGLGFDVGTLRKWWKDTPEGGKYPSAGQGRRGASYAYVRDDNPWNAEGFVSDRSDAAIFVRRGEAHTHMKAIPVESAARLLEASNVVAPQSRLVGSCGVQLADGRDLVITTDRTFQFSGRPWARAFLCESGDVREIAVEVGEGGQGKPITFQTEHGTISLGVKRDGTNGNITFDGDGRAYSASKYDKEASRLYALGLPTDGAFG